MTQFLAIYMGDADALKTEMDPALIQQGMAAWGAWMQKYAGRIVVAGGPLGRTKSVSTAGVEDIRNAMTGYIVIEAQNHEEAAGLFKDHPHFTIFPGKNVEVMQCLPMPGS